MSLELKNVEKKVGIETHIYSTNLKLEKNTINVLMYLASGSRGLSNRTCCAVRPVGPVKLNAIPSGVVSHTASARSAEIA